VKYSIRNANKFSKDFERIKTQGKDLTKFYKVVATYRTASDWKNLFVIMR
jgi:mRNA-degrading endonuclease YafQ of YafQ-DinJ toxin-antitoxin module